MAPSAPFGADRTFPATGAATFKQLEAFYWASELGSFTEASRHLHTTQSAVAKRVRELEVALGVMLFDRKSRSITVTPKGEEVLGIVKELLLLRRRIGEAAAGTATGKQSSRIGVTDLAAMTWLPNWLAAIREHDPDLSLLPSVGLSSQLLDDFVNEKLDFVVVPDAYADPRFKKIDLAIVSNAWVASPLYSDEQYLPLHQIVQRTLITQTHASGVGKLIGSWLASRDASIQNPMYCSNLGAMVSLTLSGFGIGFLPDACLGEFLRSGRLHIVASDASPPPVHYVGLYREVDTQGPTGLVMQLAKETCDFERDIWSAATNRALP